MFERECEMTWDEFKAWIGEGLNEPRRWLFRGHRDQEWTLTSRFHREAPAVGMDLKQFLSVILPEVYHQLSSDLDVEFDLRKFHGQVSLLSILQHHGFPTPLLDWTYSPYMAAYFGFREVNSRSPSSDAIKIFVFEYMAWYEEFGNNAEILQDAPYVFFIKPLARYNPRLINQKGAFTFSNVGRLEDHFVDSEEFPGAFLPKVIRIPVSERPRAIRELDMMGVNDRALFPGMDGSCTGLRSRFFSPDTVGPTPSQRMDDVLKLLNVTAGESGGTGA